MQNQTFIKKFFRILLGLMLIYAGASHLLWNRTEFLAQVPDWLPLGKDLTVIISGFAELILGFALVFFKKIRTKVGWAVAFFFIAVFPGNIHQFVNHVDGFRLNTDTTRGLRLLFQPLFVVWALWSTGAWSEWRNKRKFKKN